MNIDEILKAIYIGLFVTILILFVLMGLATMTLTNLIFVVSNVVVFGLGYYRGSVTEAIKKAIKNPHDK